MEKRVIIPTNNWDIALETAVEEADDVTVLVVDTEAKADLIRLRLNPTGKTVKIVIERIP